MGDTKGSITALKKHTKSMDGYLCDPSESWHPSSLPGAIPVPATIAVGGRSSSVNRQ